MSATKAAKKVPAQGRPPVPMAVPLLITERLRVLGIGPADLAEAVGFSTAAASMVKNGAMRLPMAKVERMAQILEVDPMYLARLVDAEAGGRNLFILEALAGQVALTESEQFLIARLRKAAGGRDVDVRLHPGLLKALEARWSEASARERALHDIPVTPTKN